ncbi:hypothetical protein K9L67_03060 [Candidatus Woesearchaeota archaeon]|nr:hypothetical protein [Candidatus Woesearchaeota archaeon]MCF7901181.1 hypothetical protein [Candidatus Woesearchaeota archaeon]MCF8013805.1 hypothetical protein [Candidatus Woesearchaeota archaeon]
MADNKEEKKPHIEKYEKFEKNSNIVEEFLDNVHIKYHGAISKSLLKEGKAWVNKNGNYDKKVIAKGDKKVLDDLTDTIMSDIISHINPLFEKMYNLKMPEFKDNPLIKDFYRQLVGINREELFNIVDKNKENFNSEIYEKLIRDKHIEKLKGRLESTTHEHINHKEHLEDYLKEYKLMDYFDKSTFKSFKESEEARYLLPSILKHVKDGKSPDYTFLENVANSYKQNTEGRLDIGKYLVKYDSIKKPAA